MHERAGQRVICADPAALWLPAREPTRGAGSRYCQQSHKDTPLGHVAQIDAIQAIRGILAVQTRFMRSCFYREPFSLRIPISKERTDHPRPHFTHVQATSQAKQALFA
ncbi:hypothetical protein LIA77_07169 [Sarocladium implicatum]|nr:hypothetical protein LIA77_07169 [Sarocladium implicatum]